MTTPSQAAVAGGWEGGAVTPADLQRACRQLELATYDLAQAATYDRLAYQLRSDAVHTLLETPTRDNRDHAIAQLSQALTRDRAAHKLRRDAAARLVTLHHQLLHPDPVIHRLPPLQRVS